MPIVGFPSKIQVKLGSLWQAPGGGAGNDLEQNQDLVLTKDPGSENWYEDENGGTSANRSTNRVRYRPFIFGANIIARLHLCQTGTDAWYGGFALSVRAGTSPVNYGFKELWRRGSQATPTASVPIGTPAFRYATQQASVYAGASCGVISTYNYAFSFYPATQIGALMSVMNQLFSTMEEYVPSALAPDKTTYRYG